MEQNSFFTDGFLKQLRKTSKLHSQFTTENTELKKRFKECINEPTLGTIVTVVCKCGYEDEQNTVKNFYDKVNSGNFDDADIEIFKNIVMEYKKQIMSELDNKDAPSYHS